MKQSGFYHLARLFSSLSLFGILLCIHMNFTLVYFLPPQSAGVMNAVYIFFFTGVALGAVLCPIFLPLPGVNCGADCEKNKPLAKSLCFICAMIAVEFIFRSLGLRVWLSSVTIRSLMSIPEGMLTTMCYGLFYLTWLNRPQLSEAPQRSESGVNRTGRFCSLVLGALLLASVLARYYSVPLLENVNGGRASIFGSAINALISFKLIKWCMLVLGISACFSVFFTRKISANSSEDFQTAPLSAAPLLPPMEIKTNLPMIIRLLSLASVFTILNGILNMRMLPLYSNETVYNPNYLLATALVLVLGYLAGRSINRFIRRFTLPAVVLFILVSCLPLFEEYPLINIIMSTLVVIAHYTVWVVFTTALVEYYAGGFWFYGIASGIFFSVVFAFFAPVIAPFVPNDEKYRVLFIIIAAVVFMLLALRFIIPKQQQGQQIFKAAKNQREPYSDISALEEIFKERDLSQREIEVANLLIKEGLGNKEIGKRLYITAGTAKLHLSKIYQKFGVKTRAEFMALFVIK